MPKMIVAPLLLATAMLAAGGAFAADPGVACKASGHPPSSTGVVMLHGRQGGASADAPPGSGDYYLQPERKKIEATGFRVVEPNMPWSMTRAYDRSYQESMDEIALAVVTLKKTGVRRVVIDGFSMGGNAALGYAALRGGVDAVMVVSPGLVPENPEYEKELATIVGNMRQAIAAGQGDKIDMYKDLAVWTGVVITTPVRLLSYYDPDGDEIMSKNAAKMKPGVPLFWLVGERDKQAYALGKDYAFDKAPPNRLNRYIVIDGDHLDTPKLGADLVVAWLKCL